MCKAFYSQLEKTLSQHKLASLVSSSQNCSGAWLNCLPNSATGGLLDDKSFRIAISFYLGLRLCSPHKCRCGAQIDVLGRHPLSCKLSAGRIPRHCALNDLIKSALNKAGFSSQLEPVGLDREDGKRPDGLTIFPYKAGKCLIWDATCSDSFSPSHLLQSVANPSWASQQAEMAKKQKYRSLADRHIFVPLAVETSGIFGSHAFSFLSDLGKRISKAKDEPKETKWLLESLSLAIVRGNAQAIRCVVS